MRILPVIDNHFYFNIILLIIKQTVSFDHQNLVKMKEEIIETNLKLEKNILAN